MDLLSKTETVFFQKSFSRLKLENQTMKNKEFEECTFEKCSFVQGAFESCRFTECTFNECVLSAIKPTNSLFVEVVFKDSKVIGIDWTKARRVHSLEFYKSQINYSNFRF